MSDGCVEERRMSCAGCPKYWSCDRTKETRKAFAELFDDARKGGELDVFGESRPRYVL